MTYENNCTLPNELLAQIADEGLACLPELIQTLINTAMQIERQQHLGVGPYERSAERQGLVHWRNHELDEARCDTAARLLRQRPIYGFPICRWPA